MRKEARLEWDEERMVRKWRHSLRIMIFQEAQLRQGVH